MTQAESDILHAIRSDLAVIKRDVNDLRKGIWGNGRPGAIDRLAVVEQRQTDCLARGQSKTGVALAACSVIIAGLAIIAQLIA